MLRCGEIIPRKEYAVTLVILLQVGLLHAPILERNTRIFQLYYNLLNLIEIFKIKFPAPDLSYSTYWKEYTDTFIGKLSSGNFDLESTQLTEWVRQEELPSNAYHSEMYKESTNKEDYGRCILFSTCTGSTANVISDSFVVTNKACLEKHQRHNKTSCQNENLKLLEVTYPA